MKNNEKNFVTMPRLHGTKDETNLITNVNPDYSLDYHTLAERYCAKDDSLDKAVKKFKPELSHGLKTDPISLKRIVEFDGVTYDLIGFLKSINLSPEEMYNYIFQLASNKDQINNECEAIVVEHTGPNKSVQENPYQENVASVSANFKAYKSAARNIIDQYTLSFNNPEHKAKVEYLRSKINNRIEYKELKQTLQTIAPGVIYDGQRQTAANVSYYTNMMGLDIDLDDKLKKVEIRKKLIESFGEYIISLVDSPSGNGIHTIWRKACNIPENHIKYVEAASERLKQCGIFIDENAKSVYHKFIVGFDANPYFNPNAIPWQEKKEPKIKPREPKKEVGENNKRQVLSNDEMDNLIEPLLSHVKSKGYKFIDKKRHEYVSYLAYVAFSNGIELDVLIDGIDPHINIRQQKDHLAAIERHYKNTSRDQFGDCQFLIKKKSEKKEEEDRKLTSLTMKEELSKRYEFKYNVVKQYPEFRKLGEGNAEFEQLTTYDINSIDTNLRDAGFSFYSESLRIILNSDFCQKYDPIKYYLDNLSYDGETDYIGQLEETMEVKNPAFKKATFTRFLVSMIACMYDSVPNHLALVFISEKQARGKSRWVNAFCPKSLRGKYSWSGTIRPGDKDFDVLQSQYVLMHFDEFDSLSKSDQSKIKEYLTRDKTSRRLVYASREETFHRKASIIASSNNMNLLNDPTGSRRYCVYDVINMNDNHSVDMDGVFAQAFHLYKSGYRYWFDKDEIEIIEENNKPYQEKTIEQEVLESIVFKPNVDGIETQRVTSSKLAGMIRETLSPDVIINPDPQLIGKIMRKLGFEQGKSGTTYWKVIFGNQINEYVARYKAKKGKTKKGLPTFPDTTESIIDYELKFPEESFKPSLKVDDSIDTTNLNDIEKFLSQFDE